MKNFSLFFFVLFPAMCSGQWTSQVGMNVIPLFGKTLELTSEISRHPAYSLTFNAGYTSKSGHEGLTNRPVYDGISDRRSSGLFAKAGGRIYLASLKGRERRSNFYVGGLLIISQYKQTGLQRLFYNQNYDDPQIPVSVKGVAFSPAFSLGFTRRITDHLTLEWGAQKAFVIREDNYLGLRRRNYQPGAGSGQSDPFLGYLQGNLSLKLTLK